MRRVELKGVIGGGATGMMELKGERNLEGGEIEESKRKRTRLGGINPRIPTPKEKFELESVYEIEFRFKDRCTPRILESSEHLLRGAEQGG